ncbi:aminotransferase class I/II-fold pyridoxal phosphate-dependent enzyme [Nocardia sp. IBHARD005]|uniref:aminotransferase class I/II-fold pyridoxal phosphate-dependent enzyme n=1 Tax=Nocardia sp. IBHARD005 TaxID=3457765 RepID=UPI0040590E02
MRPILASVSSNSLFSAGLSASPLASATLPGPGPQYRLSVELCGILGRVHSECLVGATGIVEPQEAGVSVTVADRVRYRVEGFRRERAEEWGGGHPLCGSPPLAGDIVLTSNDYLALGRDPQIISAMCAALRAAGRYRDDQPRTALEVALATHLGASSAILCQSGWEANIGLLQSIGDPDTPVYVDSRAHMSLRYGARIAGAPVFSFRHKNIDTLRALLAMYGPGIIAVDAIDSTAGSQAPVERLCAVAEESGSLLVVDESHTLGVEGPLGAGTVVGLGLTDRVAYRTASLAKAFAGRAGVVTAGDPDFADYFRMHAYPAVFSSAVLGRDIAALTATLALIKAAEPRRVRLREVGLRIRSALGALGFDLAGAAGHIVSLQTGPASHAIAVRDYLADLGVFGSIFCPPATPGDSTLIRFSLHAALTEGQIDRLLTACAAVAHAFGPIPPAPTVSHLTPARDRHCPQAAKGTESSGARNDGVTIVNTVEGVDAAGR